LILNESVFSLKGYLFSYSGKLNKMFLPTQDKYHRSNAGQQMHAPIGNRLQPWGVRENHKLTFEKWFEAACFQGLCEKYCGRPVLGLLKKSKN